MKSQKDAIVLVIAILVIAGCVYLGYRLLVPRNDKANTVQNVNNTNTKYTNTNIDEGTLLDLQKLSNFPQPALENIGKNDLFAK